jgi:uncharacterized protein YaiI (UPF0178 family)
MSDVSSLSEAEVAVSRVIEYFPPSGDTTIARDCKYASASYSKGAVVMTDTGATFECSGDKEGTWVKKSAK